MTTVDWTRYNDDFLMRHFGLMALPYGAAWPDMIPLVRTLLVDRMGKLPFLPDDWLSTVRYLHGKDGRILVPVPSTANHSQGAGASFLTDPVNRAIWDHVTEEVRQARLAFGEKKLDQGRAIMERANNNAQFWEKAYQTARVMAAPITGLKAAFWDNPWLGGTLVYGTVGLLVFLALRRRYKG